MRASRLRLDGSGWTAGLLLLSCFFLSAAPSAAAEGRNDQSGETGSSPQVRVEPGILPAVSYDSDLGLGFGVLANLAKIDPELEPYRWRLAAQVFFYLKPQPSGPPRLPYQSHYLRLDKPGLAGGRLRLRVELRFQKQSNAGYFGMGQGSPQLKPWEAIDEELLPELWAAARRHNEYDRIYPSLGGELRVALPSEFFAFARSSLTWNWITLWPGSRLEADSFGASGGWVKQQLVGLERHGALTGGLGVAWDSRDHEAAPTRGHFHEVSLRVGGLLELPGAWGGANITGRVYAPLLGDRLSLASRVIVDLLWGDVPFYELARYGGTEAAEGPGGSLSVRGLPARRYHGRIKLIGNFELRSRFLFFELSGQASSLGAVAFVDAGRVWSDYLPRPDLDSGGAPLGVGLGGGLRLQIGETFIIRLDVAWSPGDVGVAFDVGHVF